ncbi:MAG: bifunctional proline dehydrogenase/L-glutamate gamma-semialdehyde dehydrogenase PutA [Halopseudomonas sp.]
MFAAERILQGDWLERSLDKLWQNLIDNTLVDQPRYCRTLLPLIQLPAAQQSLIDTRSARWIEAIRQHGGHHSGVETLLSSYSLDRPEGVALMSLAEALLRIPDNSSADAFIRDRLLSAHWHSDTAEPLWAQASQWGLDLARRWLEPAQQQPLEKLLHRASEPILRQALKQACGIAANQFVMGEDIYTALDQSQSLLSQGDSYSFDMLGEAALTRQESARYLDAYRDAIIAVGQCDSFNRCQLKPSVSIKLSALHPRFEALQAERCLPELLDALTQLIEPARQYGVPLTIDAEESERLEPSLQLFELLLGGPAQGWGELGLAVQAYSKRALPQLCWLTKLSQQCRSSIPVRLVKGAYWDSEIKRAQQLGLSDYPVFSNKAATDINYQACARLLLSPFCIDRLRPQFATHNAQTLSQLLGYASEQALQQPSFECQRLHGMGESLYQTAQHELPQIHCRVYAPVGAHQQLLPYLVRRLLENGANSSFVNQVMAPNSPTDELTASPDKLWQQHPSELAKPSELFAPGRQNSLGLNLHYQSQRSAIQQALLQPQPLWQAVPLIDGEPDSEGKEIELRSPIDRAQVIGRYIATQPEQALLAIECVCQAQPQWAKQPLQQRTAVLRVLADKLEQSAPELIALLALEAGKCTTDALAELREAVDFCRYYAEQATQRLGQPQTLAGVTGEHNSLSYVPRGLFVCISPWNFPLAIFIGQVSAALVTGNGVIAKPANSTPLISQRCVQLLLEAGLPAGVLALLPGPSGLFMETLLDDPRVAGVAFTGSSDTAVAINRQLAQRKQAPIAAFIAETAGINTLIADTTTLPEQLVKDALYSAFGCAGQRCSALRILCLPEPLADSVELLLQQAMDELTVGSPLELSSDIGPVINRQAQQQLQNYIESRHSLGRLIHQSPLAESLNQSHYIAPTLLRLQRLDELDHEPFGPILHLLRYRPEQLDSLVDQINASGYGLTVSIHSRNASLAQRLAQQLRVGNIYINRDQVGAVVGCQPFGGCGLSGTGPKAGGPNYLNRFLIEKCISTNTTAWGGNSELLSR